MNKTVTDKIFNEGYKVFGSGYSNVDNLVEEAKLKYESVLSYRVKSDTPGLKMFIVLVK